MCPGLCTIHLHSTIPILINLIIVARNIVSPIEVSEITESLRHRKFTSVS